MRGAESRATSLLWLPGNAVQLVFTLAWSAFWITVALLTRLATGGRRAGLWLARNVWAPGLVYGAGGRISTSGLEHLDLGRPYLFVANHRSWIDIPVLFMAIAAPLHFLGKRELERVPFLGWYMRAMGMVFIDRRERVRAVEGVDRIAALLASGSAVVSFPEGTRSRDGRLGAFKSGGFGAAIRAGVEVVPVALLGTGEVLPPGGFRVRPGRIEARIGAPISARDFAPRDRAGLAVAAERAVAELLAATAPVARPSAPRESPRAEAAFVREGRVEP